MNKKQKINRFKKFLIEVSEDIKIFNLEFGSFNKEDINDVFELFKYRSNIIISRKIRVGLVGRVSVKDLYDDAVISDVIGRESTVKRKVFKLCTLKVLSLKRHRNKSSPTVIFNK